eukprot:1364533-Amorphochlora_amoeboformis.AAC.1
MENPNRTPNGRGHVSVIARRDWRRGSPHQGSPVFSPISTRNLPVRGWKRCPRRKLHDRMASVLELAFATALMMVPIHRAKLGEINGIPRWRRLRGGLDLLAFGDQNMTLPSVEEMKEQIRAHH